MTYSEIIGTERLQNWRFNRVFEKFLLEEFFCFDNSIIELKESNPNMSNYEIGKRLNINAMKVGRTLKKIRFKE